MLVYGIPSAVKALNKEFQEQNKRMRALANAQREMATTHAENRIRRAINSRVPPSIKFRVEVGDPCRVYREKRNRWKGRFIIQRLKKKLVWVTEGNIVKPFNVTEVISAVVRGNVTDIERLIKTHQIYETVENHFTELLKSSDPLCKSPRSEEAMKQEIDGLTTRNCFSEINEITLPPNANTSWR